MCCDSPDPHGSIDGVIFKDPESAGFKDPNAQPTTSYQNNAFTTSFEKLMNQLSADADKYAPLEDQLIAKRERYGSQPYQQEQINAAKQDVSSAFSKTRAAATNRLASMGVNPNDPRALAMNRDLTGQEALATAGAGTKARRDVEAQDFNSLAAVSQFGNAKMDQALKAGATGGNLYMQGQDLNARQLMQGRELDWKNFWGWRDAQNQSDRNAQNDSASGYAGIGQIIGGIGSIALPFMLSSREAKTDKRPYRGGRDAIRALPIEEWRYKDGMGDEQEHIGTYAEDFADVTGKGDGKVIPVVDAIGVTMAAVKEIDKAVRRLERRL